ncbi:MAG: DUF1801 domain-containing protein [Pseudomonadota bacterium]
MPDPLQTIVEDRRAEAERLDAVFRDITGWAPRLWGKMIGYGLYRYHRKGDPREYEFFATGFNFRTRDIALHILPGYQEYAEIAARLGPHKRGKSCWYIKSLDAVDDAALCDLIKAGLADLSKTAKIEAT